ncbi:MAG: RimK/LysX family protein [Balneolaceae bacterium]
MTLENRNDKKLIGRIEKVDFPDLNVFQLKAKIDTGAYTSSLHCHKIELNSSKKDVSFYLLDPSHPEYNEQIITSPVEDIRSVRSSNGLAEDRIIIKTRIYLHECLEMIQLSLTDRSEMRYPVLLGRKFLQDRYIVDVSKKFIGNLYK